MKYVFLFFLSAIAFEACEKDDICVDGDTPLVIVRFYDAEDTTEFKAVTNLRVIGLGQESTLNTFTDRSSIDSIGLPLQINQPTTSFQLIFESEDDEDDMETGNIDTLSFSYSTQEVFVSRACGFIANYDEVTPELTTDTANWIQEIEVVSSTVTNQISAHVKIFH